MFKTLRSTLFIAGTVSSALVAMPSVSYGIGFTVLAPENFTNIQGNSSPSTTVGTGTAAGTLNSTALDFADKIAVDQIGGFGGFFSSNFISVGGLDNQTIGGSIRQINSRARSQVINLNAVDLNVGVLLRFDYIFAGYIGSGASSNFVIQLTDVFNNSLDFTSVTLDNSITGQPPGFNGRFQRISGRNQTGVILGSALSQFQPGEFTVQIAVDEPTSSNPTNTVAGFNNISIEAVPYEFEAAAGVLLFAGYFAGKRYLKNKKAKSV